MILDTCALLMARSNDESAWRARLTFANARHAVVDLCHIFEQARVTEESCHRPVAHAEIPREVELKLRELQKMYEPYCGALSNHLRMPLPPWDASREARDNWQGGTERDIVQDS